MKHAVHFSSKRDDWGTPQWLFDQLNEEFRFTLDVCASEKNAKCEKYFTKKQDGLKRAWRGNRCWMNPPYGRDVGGWVGKAWWESTWGDTAVVGLLAARTDTRWWNDCVMPYAAEARFIKGRLKFEGAKNPAPFPSVIVVFDSEERERNNGRIVFGSLVIGRTDRFGGSLKLQIGSRRGVPALPDGGDQRGPKRVGGVSGGGG